ncbi:hypothetical protein D3C72_2214610 [compost metagenome]
MQGFKGFGTQGLYIHDHSSRADGRTRSEQTELFGLRRPVQFRQSRQPRQTLHQSTMKTLRQRCGQAIISSMQENIGAATFLDPGRNLVQPWQ